MDKVIDLSEVNLTDDKFIHPEFVEKGIYKLRTNAFPSENVGVFNVVEIHNESRSTLIVVKCNDGSYQDLYYNGYESRFKLLTEPGCTPDWKLEDFGDTPNILIGELVTVNEYWESLGVDFSNEPEDISSLLAHRNKLLKELVGLKDEYIELLGDELDELSVIVHSHGWRSSRIDKGIELRSKITAIEELLK